MNRIFLLLLCSLVFVDRLPAQPDTLSVMLSAKPSTPSAFLKKMEKKQKPAVYRFHPLEAVIPVAMIGVGTLGIKSDWMERRNEEMREEMQEHFHHRLTFDNYTQYVPLLAAYGLKMGGCRGLHDVRRFTVVAATAYTIMGVTVNALKYTTAIRRPDGSTRNSFPSGHTATAFCGAELLRREYWHVSPWIGLSGYMVAAGTGLMRMYNNRHWMTDVLAGAGIGILSAQAAYMLYPVITRACFPRLYRRNAYLAPTLTNGEKGVTFGMSF